MLLTNYEALGPQEAPTDELPNLLRAHAEQGRRRLSQLEKAVADNRRQIQDLAVTTEAELTLLRSKVTPTVLKMADQELPLQMGDKATNIDSGGNAGHSLMTLKAAAVKAVHKDASNQGQEPDPFLTSALELIEAAFRGLESSIQRAVALPEMLTAEHTAERERLRGELEQAEGRLREDFSKECAKVQTRVDESMRLQRGICEQRIFDGLEALRHEHSLEIQATARKCETQLDQAKELRTVVQSEVMLELDQFRQEIETSRQVTKAAVGIQRQSSDEGRPAALCDQVLPEATAGSRGHEMLHTPRAARDPLSEPAPEPAGALGPSSEAAAAVAAGQALAEAALHFDVVSSELKIQAEALARASEARIATAEAAFSTELHQVHRALSACAVQLQALQEGMCNDVQPRMAKLEAAVNAGRQQVPWRTCTTAPVVPLQAIKQTIGNAPPASPIMLTPTNASGTWSGVAPAGPVQVQRCRRPSNIETHVEDARNVLWPAPPQFVEADKANTVPSSRTQSPVTRRSSSSLARSGDVDHSPRYATLANARQDWRNTFNKIMRTSSPPPASRHGGPLLPASTDD